MEQLYKVPLALEPQPEGGYTVTSPALPGLVTEGDTVHEALENARDALIVVLEIYDDLDKPLPPHLRVGSCTGTMQIEHLIAIASRPVAPGRGRECS